MRKEMKYEKSYESRKYGTPSKALGRSNGPLTAAPDALKTRKEPGQLKADPHSQIPQPRGYCCSEAHD